MIRLVLLLLTCLCLSACNGVDPDSPLAQRKAIFKQLLKTSEELGGMLRGRIAFDEQRFAAGALKLDGLAQQPWQHFPAVKEADKTSAKDEVWQRQARFQQLARVLEGSTAELLAATRQQPLQPGELAPLQQRVEDACEACHQEFRDY